jgi:hypothetical protein
MSKKKIPIPEVIAFPTVSDRKLYFDNNKVEDQLVRYIWTGCTDVPMRDAIMVHAEELIRQIIRAHGLHKIYPGHEESAFGDLFQTAWIQIERTLYKYKAKPHCANCYNARRPQDSILYEPHPIEYGILTPEEVAGLHVKCPTCSKYPTRILYRGTSKVFNLWSQIARTRILAYIKKESRDYKNSDAYKSHLNNKYRVSTESGLADRFIIEAREIFKYNDIHLTIIEALSKIIQTDDRPYEGIITKLVNHTGLPRSQIAGFLKMVRMRSNEFTDSPLNDKPKPREIKGRGAQFEED